jgi:hypothetical protein
MLTMFGYSLVGLLLVMFFARNMSRKTRLLLALLTVIMLNGPTLVALFLHGR